MRGWAVETMPEILLAFSHGFGEMWHSDMISAFLPPFHAKLPRILLARCSSQVHAFVRALVRARTTVLCSTCRIYHYV